MSSLRDRLTYANVMATIAVFLALGGISWAATSLPRNSVGSKQLRNNAVTGSKVKNRSLTSADLKKGTLTTGATGATGATGPAGPKGDTGATGPSDAYTAQNSAAGQALTASFATVVTSPQLPAGNYVLEARANVAAGPAPATIICSMADDAAQNFTVAANGLVALSMNSTIKLAAPGTVDLHCIKQAGAATVYQAHITAIRVGTITGP